MYVLLSIVDRERANTKCMHCYQCWTGRDKIQNVCHIINVGQGETKYKMYVLLSMLDMERQNTKGMSYYQCWTGGHKIQNVCIIINVGQGDTKYKMYYYQCWTGGHKIQNICIIINVGQGDTKYKIYVLLSTLDRVTFCPYWATPMTALWCLPKETCGDASDTP